MDYEVLYYNKKPQRSWWRRVKRIAGGGVLVVGVIGVLYAYDPSLFVVVGEVLQKQMMGIVKLVIKERAVEPFAHEQIGVLVSAFPEGDGADASQEHTMHDALKGFINARCIELKQGTVEARSLPVYEDKQVINSVAMAQEVGKYYRARIHVWAERRDSGFVPHMTVVNVPQETYESLPCTIEVYNQKSLPLKVMIVDYIPDAVLPTVTNDIQKNVSAIVGLALYMQGNFQDAFPLFMDSIVKEGIAYAELSSLLWYVGTTSIFLERYDEASLYLTKSIESGTAPYYVYANRAAVFILQAAYQDAIRDCDAAITAQPLNAIAYYNRSIAHVAIGDLDAAQIDIQKALQNNPDFPYAQALKATIEHALSERTVVQTVPVEEKSEDVPQEPVVDVRDRSMLVQLAMTAVANGDLEQAVSYFTKIIDKNKRDVEALVNRASLYAKQKLYDNALRDYNAVLAIAAHHAKAMEGRASVNRLKGTLKDALADYGRALQQSPENAQLLFERGTTFARKGDQAKAIQDFTRAIELNGTEAKYFINRGVAYGISGQYDLAIADYSRALDLTPRDVDALLNRASIYIMKKEYAQALVDCTQVIALAPREIDAYMYRALCYEEMGQRERAQEDYERVREYATEGDTETIRLAEEKIAALSK